MKDTDPVVLIHNTKTLLENKSMSENNSTKYTEFYINNLGKCEQLQKPIFLDQSKNAIVLFETRDLKHLEFTLKYTYSQLQNNFWSAYIFCSSKNIDGITKMMDGFENIHFVTIENEFKKSISDVSDYNKLLLSKRLWKYFQKNGIEKILLFQEDLELVLKIIYNTIILEHLGKLHTKMVMNIKKLTAMEKFVRWNMEMVD